MKLSHLSIIFLIIILPISIICRNTVNEYFITLKDQVRLNNVIDVATQDALDTLVELNDEFQMIYLNERFDVTQALAKEAIKSFFHTLAINFNMPYIQNKTEAYFSMYVPAIVVIGYDGFFIYSVDETSAGGYAYQISPKIPYAYEDSTTGAIINFTLGDYIKIYTNGKYYEGELTDDYYAQSKAKYDEFLAAYGGTGNEAWLLNDIDTLTSDMSVILATLYEKQKSNPTGAKIVPDFLIPGVEGTDVPFRRDYGSGDLEPSDFHKKRREVIIEVIVETLQQEINSHETYAKTMGSSYDFGLPEIANDDWINSINDISVMSFIQGMPIGVNSYYNNYALGGSRIVQTDYIYATSDKYYHAIDCDIIKAYIEGTDFSIVENVFVNRVQAAEYGYYPCMKCHP